MSFSALDAFFKLRIYTEPSKTGACGKVFRSGALIRIRGSLKWSFHQMSPRTSIETVGFGRRSNFESLKSGQRRRGPQWRATQCAKEPPFGLHCDGRRPQGRGSAWAYFWPPTGHRIIMSKRTKGGWQMAGTNWLGPLIFWALVFLAFFFRR